MANKRANARAKASKMNASHSWPWVIVRIIQTAICMMVLGLSVYLRFSYKSASNIVRRDEDSSDEKDEKDEKGSYSSTPPWLMPSYSQGSGDYQLYDKAGKWGFSPYVSLGILMGVSLFSLLSSFASLLLYCLEKLSLKLILIWDFFLAVVWAAGVIFIGKLISDNAGWKSNNKMANLYKLNFGFGVVAVVLFVISGSLAVHLIMVAKGSGGKYAPMTQSHNRSGTPAPVYTTYDGPATDLEHGVVNKTATEYRP